MGDAVAYGWKKFQANAGQIILAGLVVLVAIVILSTIGGVIRNLIVSDPECTLTNGRGLRCTNGSGFIVGQIANMFVTFFFYVAYQVVGAGIIRGALGITEGRPFVVGEIFQLERVRQIVITALIVSAAIAIGTVLCFLPGIAAAFFLSFAIYFVIDKEMEPVAAVTASFNLVKDNLGEVFVWWLVTLGLTILGAILCGVGLIVAIPVVLIGNAFVYKKLTHQQVAA